MDGIKKGEENKNDCDEKKEKKLKMNGMKKGEENKNQRDEKRKENEKE